MAEQLESLKDTFRECGREAVVAQLGSCPQKVLRATAKAAGLPQKVSGRYLGTIELRQNILEHVLASTQVGMRWVTVRGSLYVAEITQRDRPALHGI